MKFMNHTTLNLPNHAFLMMSAFLCLQPCQVMAKKRNLVTRWLQRLHHYWS